MASGRVPPPRVFSLCAPKTLMLLLSTPAPCSLSVFLLCAPTLDTVSLVAFLLSTVDKWLFLLPLFVVFNDFFFFAIARKWTLFL